MENKFLPICKQDMIDRGWDQLDFVLVTGDAYVDHHSFGTAIISRVLENAGYKVGIIAQPDWKTTEDFMKLGRPRLGFLVNSGNMDSMVNHYSVSKKHRDKDMYSPGGKMGCRPDRAVIVYCNKIREAYKDVNIVIGGIEASLRRFAHYDYWSDRVRKSILIDSGADLLVYGMSERQIVEVANALNDGFEPKYIRHINGTCYVADTKEEIYDDYVEIPSYKEICESKEAYARAFKIQYDEQDPFRGKVIIQRHGDKYLVQNKPEAPLNREELEDDRITQSIVNDIANRNNNHYGSIPKPSSPEQEEEDDDDDENDPYGYRRLAGPHLLPTYTSDLISRRRERRRARSRARFQCMASWTIWTVSIVLILIVVILVLGWIGPDWIPQIPSHHDNGDDDDETKLIGFLMKMMF